jgi:hypothetical protein
VQRFGWLRDIGAIDYAGGTVIHISSGKDSMMSAMRPMLDSGFSALIASYIVGKRKGYDPKQPIPPGNVPLVLIGAALIWYQFLQMRSSHRGFTGSDGLDSMEDQQPLLMEQLHWQLPTLRLLPQQVTPSL